MSDFNVEIENGERFEFGQNWSQYLHGVNEDKILSAIESLTQNLDLEDLNGKSFLDIGCGSGLFSLAAYRLGADVHSLDYDPNSVVCANILRNKYNISDRWKIETGDVLNKSQLEKLGLFDIVYSWGVLHHTGSMWEAIENVANCVKPKGLLFISIYNDQGKASIRWGKIKRTYCKSSRIGKIIIKEICVCYLGFKWVMAKLIYGELPRIGKAYKKYETKRGMTVKTDITDWVGGYPFEVAKPEEIFDFLKKKGFTLEKLKTCGGNLGCNEFVMKKE